MSKPLTLSRLPDDADAPAPTIGARTVGFQYLRHHRAYVDMLNKLIEGTRYADMKLEEIVQATPGREDGKTKRIFNNAGTEQFGSGWAWLFPSNGALSIETTANAVDPMAKGTNCLLTIDVWEHAYCLDYQNERPKYLEAVLTNLLNWDFAGENLDKEGRVVRAAAE